MNQNETGQRLWRAGRAYGSFCLLILAVAWTLQAPAAFASADPHPTTSDGPECQFYRLAIQSPYSSDETAQKLLRELLSSSLTRAGFEVVENDEPHYWWASSLALDNGSASAWTTVVHAVPEIRDESIGFTTTYREVAGKNVPFFGMHSLRVFNWSDAPATATRIAEEMSQGLLPAVHRRCYDMQLAAALKKAAKEAAEKAELERIRSELVEEMNRVRANRLRTSSRKEVRIEAEERPISPPAKRGAHD